MIHKTTYEVFLESIGTAIRIRRCLLDMTQQDAAVAAGMHVNGWARAERGDMNSSSWTLHKIAGALHCPIWQLVKDAEDCFNRIK